MSTRDTEPPDARLDEVAFLARCRFPRPVAKGVARVFTEHHPAAVQWAVRRCALRTLRFLAAVNLAQSSAEHPDSPAAPPEPGSLRSGFPDGYFITALAGERSAAEILLALAGADGEELPPGTDPESHRRQLLKALAGVTPLAQYRLLVPVPEESDSSHTTTVLLGTQRPYPGPYPGTLQLPPHTPALLDPPTGRLLSLAPLLRWEPGPESGQGSLFLLRELARNEGVYAEVDGEEVRRIRRPLLGRPSEFRLSESDGERGLAAPPAVRFPDGHRLEPDHTIRGLVGRTNNTDLYRALRLTDHTPVVIQTPRLDAAENVRQRFAAKAASVEEERHPRLIEYRQVSPAPGEVIVELDYLPGGTLTDRLVRRGVLDPQETLSLLEPLCEGLAALHKKGITHLDLQPDNLVFTGDGQLRLGRLRATTCTEEPVGAEASHPAAESPANVPPEHRAGQPVGPPADLWQLGVLLSTLLVGERPLSPTSVARPPRLPRVLGDVIRRLLEPRPEDRYQTADQVVDAFRAGVDGLSPQRCIALDLEGTLLTTAHNPLPRPHLADFAEWCLETFDRVFVYTAVDERNARVIIARFVRAGVLPARFSKAAELVAWPRGAGGVLKDLRQLRLPLHWVVLLDDMRQWIVEDQRHRWVPIVPFDGTRSGDEELIHIRPEILKRFEPDSQR